MILFRHRAVATHRLCRRFSGIETEFTIAPYIDVPELGFQRSDKFCMLTIKYPAFQGLPEEERHAMYEQKKKRRAQFVEELFDHYDVSKTGYLCKDELQNALKEIGLAFDDGSVQGMLQRRGRKEKPDDALTIQRSEFPDVVREAWGQIPRMTFSDQLGHKLANLYQGQEPLHGDRALMFLGKTSPAGWALRAVRNLCPYALRGCQILQNVCNNPEFNPEYMEAWMVDRTV
ncbi:unnamed protein product [Durusdinium trenchii]|uniref:EF-hand domain-containing protein n=1 Tax=Durusdinium trenchii TaxID=1381693 RepID=A0ABP0KN83_9DINO